MSLKTTLGVAAGILVFLVVVLNYGPLAEVNKAIAGKVVADESPLAAYVIDNYRNCLNPGLFSSASAGECKVTIAQLVKLEKGESAVPEAMRYIDKYEANKLQAYGFEPKLKS